MSKAFDKIAGGLADAIAYAEGDSTNGRFAAGPACPREGGDQGHPRQDARQSDQIRRQTARSRRNTARLGAAPPLARRSGADAVGDGGCRPEGSIGFD